MNDQKAHWNELHTKGVMDNLKSQPSDFVVSISDFVGPGSRVLELGCGTGGDAKFLSDLGCNVLATDFSEAVIAKDKEWYPGIDFQVLDTGKTFSLTDNQYDVVYANLSLHYFDDETTKATFKEIRRVLKDGGLLIFRCKSVHSNAEKQGAEEITPNIYLQNGHMRHLFSVDYVDELFDVTGFEKLKNIYTEGEVYGKQASFVEAVGRKG